jgi:hypothetical protein
VEHGKSNKCAKTAALRTAISDGRALAMTVVGSLKPALGWSWNSARNAVGFNRGGAVSFRRDAGGSSVEKPTRVAKARGFFVFPDEKPDSPPVQ